MESGSSFVEFQMASCIVFFSFLIFFTSPAVYDDVIIRLDPYIFIL